ncbi:MAG: cyclic nucleotide-binding domain-containing protein [Gloeobacterales cyanobacterium]
MSSLPVQTIGLAFLVLLGITLFDGLAIRLFKRWKELDSLPKQILFGIVRVSFWIGSILIIFKLIPELEPIQAWVIIQAQSTLAGLSQLLNTPLIVAGKNHFSLANIVFLILLLLGVFFSSRALSEWIKQRLLMRLGFDTGTRETIAALIGYLLATLGFVIVLQTAGLDLSSLAVLAGVLGIGLGFGFQNLVSNFVSGLTLLFEQPIRVGDFIEVSGLLGTVEKISIRSTIVRTLDGIFVIVPNNRFIENNIINWSYRDPQSRIHLPIGVAYGTSPVLVTEVLLNAARSEPRILSYPAPKVWLKDFGDNALKFELLVWIDKPQDIEMIKSALNFLIEQELRQRHIEIPVPQRDLKIRNLSELISSIRQEPTEVTERQETPIVATTSDLSTLLRRITYFESCTDLELRSLIEQGYRKRFAAGQTIFKENDPGESFYIILSGQVEIFSEKKETSIGILNAGEFFGEISLLTGMPRPSTTRTLEETSLFVVDRTALQKLLKDQKGLAEQIAQRLAERQQVLRELGLWDEKGLSNTGEAPLAWMRKRIQTLFGT